MYEAELTTLHADTVYVIKKIKNKEE